jgi:hypothetical protein
MLSDQKATGVEKDDSCLSDTRADMAHEFLELLAEPLYLAYKLTQLPFSSASL